MIPLKLDICPQNVMMFGVQIAFYRFFIFTFESRRMRKGEFMTWLNVTFEMPC